MKKLIEPTVITLGRERVLLVHGDRYCTRDKGHQWLRRLTQNRIFPRLFLRLPFTLRADLVNKIRQSSQNRRSKPPAQMDVVTSSMLRHMQQLNTHVVIHGHIHKPGLNIHDHHGVAYRQYVLSDWDDNPQILCYDKTTGFYFKPLSGEKK